MRIIPIADHIPVLPNLFAFGPNSDRGERDIATVIRQKNIAEIDVNIITGCFLVLMIVVIPFNCKIYLIYHFN
ncbi:hypothetical protein, partial [Heyndrickxia oleronia]|uniref:hypothetical protein n=1 Tax=Heyndrickxia oleronia TaxID=38875 RepID=UPI001F43122D